MKAECDWCARRYASRRCLCAARGVENRTGDICAARH
ncbi:unnamed protein product [Leptidea sinapis]|uniref:Uncharacterized protein n=1 Tax=Leptidea sinapis TaxID=189913 RepID=A0A5E4QB24_9NEOP|nr:unnamed protein product [Leptidea sinapis]